MMQPDWQTDDGAIRLYNRDCRDVLSCLPEGTVDAVVFDPPYGIEHSSNHGASWQGTQISGDDDTQVRDFIIAWAGQLPWACFGTWKVATPPDARGVLVWDKGPAFGMGDLSFPWKASWEEIAIGGRGWEGYRDEGVIRGHIVVSWESKGRVHPHQKPVSLLEHLLSKLPERFNVICDPTMGSGTTGVACVRTGRRFVGAETDQSHFASSCERIEEELERLSLFEKPPSIIQKSLLGDDAA